MGNIQMEADQIRYRGKYRNVQEALDNGGGGGGGDVAASDVSFEDTDYNNVQDALAAALAGLDSIAASDVSFDSTDYNNVQDALAAALAGSEDTNSLGMRLEAIDGRNDVNSLSASFTAAKTSKYLIIAAFGTAGTLPTFDSATLTVNSTPATLSDFYNSDTAGVCSKYAVLDLTANDVVSLAASTAASSSGCSGGVYLLRLSKDIASITISDSEESVSGSGNLDIDYDVLADGCYIPFVFSRKSGLPTINYAYNNFDNVTNELITCSPGSGWQLALYLKAVSSKTGGDIAVSAVKDGVTCCGVARVTFS